MMLCLTIFLPADLEANYNLCNLLLKEKKYLQTAKCLAPIIKVFSGREALGHF